MSLAIATGARCGSGRARRGGKRVMREALRLFDALCALESRERSLALDQRCGDDLSFRAVVQAMLDHDAAGERSLGLPPAITPLRLLAGGLDDTVGCPPDARLPACGERVGRYEVRELLGMGGMGVVYRGHDPELDRDVALKLARVRGAPLVDEARALARLDHPNVITVYDIGEHQGDMFVAMELVRGVTMRRWLAAAPRTVAEVLAAFCAAGRGLAAAHAAGLVHRDFKPDNVLVRDDGRVLIADFGLARPVGRVEGLGGTPAYMAPEQLRGAELDAHADQFSYCVALHEALFGRRPFAPSSRAAAAIGLVPAHVRAAVRRGLAIDPGRRHDSMAALLDELSR